MTRRTHRRRVLSLIGTAGVLGITGQAVAGRSDDENGEYDDEDNGGEDADEEYDDADDDDEEDEDDDEGEDGDGHHGGDHHDEKEDDHHDDHHEGDHHDGELNEADVHFLQMMIPHHVQAIEMAELVPGRTARTELCELAEEIIAVQDEEIEMMEAWLESDGHDPHAHDMDHDEMDGMLTDEEMDELAAAEGDEFDRLFVSGMIHHHEGAIEMAEDVLTDGDNDEIAALAEEVIEVQEAEIDLMQEWCRSWF